VRAMEFKAVADIGKSVLARFFSEQWGSPQIVISSGIFQCGELDGFAVMNEQGAIAGLITFHMEGAGCEIISLDSLEPNQGIGTSLIRLVEQRAKQAGCRRISLITTNDNLHALGFYQRRGYKLVKLYPNAVDRARQIKPEIPLYADNGIPIRDELVLEKELD
jgi:GNAT superfamily N-acetyltransferase